jgi:hypothetical protein
MPVKLFGRLCEKMMTQIEKEGDNIDKVDIPMFLQQYVYPNTPNTSKMKLHYPNTQTHYASVSHWMSLALQHLAMISKL